MFRNFVFDRAVFREANSMIRIYLICCYSFLNVELHFAAIQPHVGGPG